MNEFPRFGWPDDSTSDARPWADWPRCPRCGTRRETACPDCAVPGADFALAELDPAADLLPAPASPEHAEGCRSDHASCCDGGGALRCAEAEDPGEDDTLPGAAGGPAVMLVCPTCDEAFVPRFFRRCRHCEHDFGSGPDVEPVDEQPVNYRVLWAVFAVLAALVGLWIYLVWLFRQ